MASSQLSFTPNRSLLLPKFNSYKLTPSSPASSPSIHLIPNGGVELPSIPDGARLSFNEVQDRARLNAMSVCVVDGRNVGVWVDGEDVYGVEVDEALKPTFHVLCTLPTTLSTSSDSLPEYPRCIPIPSSPHKLLISDGHGHLYFLTLSVSSSYKLSASLDRSFSYLSNETLTPFRLHAVRQGRFALLSTVRKVDLKPVAPLSSQPGSRGLGPSVREKIGSNTVFDYFEADMGAEDAMEVNGTTEVLLKEEWKMRSQDLPHSVEWDEGLGAYILISASSPYHLHSPPSPSTTHPTVPLPSSSSAPPFIAGPSTPSLPTPKPAPFSWVQDTDSLTLAFPLPSSTPTSSIRPTFSKSHLTLSVGTAASSLSPSASRSNLVVSHKKLWDEIDPYTSLWTFDREAEGRDGDYGLLSLHLEKKNPGTKWSDVFAPVVLSALGDETRELTEEEAREVELESVSETLDPSELVAIVESMEKYSQQGQHGAIGGLGSDAPPPGPGEGVTGEGGIPTSLMGEEVDVEVDGDSGRGFVVTFVIPPSTEGGECEFIKPHPTVPYSLLSTPLPSPAPSASIVIKHDVDGLLFAPPTSLSDSTTWTHTSTFPALAFVLATKTSSKFTYHLSSRLAIVLDSPAGIGKGAGNLFGYYKPAEGELIAKQVVGRIGSTSSGALLGVVGLGEKDGEELVLVLCEKELVVFRL